MKQMSACSRFKRAAHRVCRSFAENSRSSLSFSLARQPVAHEDSTAFMISRQNIFDIRLKTDDVDWL
jgi:hypothetical protein